MIKIAAISGNSKQLRSIRRVIVYRNNLDNNGVEKYRVVAQRKNPYTDEWIDTLVYAKGLIKLNYNDSFIDSNNTGHNILDKYSGVNKLPKSLYAFYNDGFYLQDTLFVDPAYNADRFNRYNYQTLSGIITGLIPASHYAPVTFDGWYLTPTPTSQDVKINTIADIYSKTTLFNESSSTSLPQITLYAHWNIPKFNVTVKNILRRGTRSSCLYNGTWTNAANVVTFSLLYKTDVITYVDNQIPRYNAGHKYSTWGHSEIDYNAAISDGTAQSFLGWSTQDYVATNSRWPYDESRFTIYTKLPIKENLSLYPQFKMIAIWQKTTITINNGTYTYGNGWRSFTPDLVREWTASQSNDLDTSGKIYDYIDVILTIDHNYAMGLPRNYQDEYNRFHWFSWTERDEPSFSYTYMTDAGTGGQNGVGRYLAPSGTVVFRLTESID